MVNPMRWTCHLHHNYALPGDMKTTAELWFTQPWARMEKKQARKEKQGNV